MATRRGWERRGAHSLVTAVQASERASVMAAPLPKPRETPPTEGRCKENHQWLMRSKFLNRTEGIFFFFSNALLKIRRLSGKGCNLQVGKEVPAGVSVVFFCLVCARLHKRRPNGLVAATTGLCCALVKNVNYGNGSHEEFLAAARASISLMRASLATSWG